MKNCDVCEADLSEIFTTKEMMLGFRDEFEYAVCQNCGTIQILTLPDAIVDYYPRVNAFKFD